MQKDDFALAFSGGDLIVLCAGQTLRQLSQFVVVSCEQSLGGVLR